MPRRARRTAVWTVSDDEHRPARARRADSAQLVRQWAILRRLVGSPRPFAVKELAEQFGVSKATIERDLATLEQQFALIEETEGKQKRRYRVDQTIRALESIQFGAIELLAVHAALAGLRPLAGTPLHDDLNSVATKLRGFLGPRHNGGLDALTRVYQPHARGHIHHTDSRVVIDDLTDAIARRQICRVIYYSAWNRTTREHRLRPLRLVWHRSALYVLGCLGDRRVVTTLAVQRIRDLELLGETFPDPHVDLDDHIRRAFGIFVGASDEEVEIVFEPDIAWRIEERIYHLDEQKTRLPDGRLCYRLRTNAQWEIIPWVLSFGPRAALISPAPWRAAIAQMLAAMAPLYRGCRREGAGRRASMPPRRETNAQDEAVPYCIASSREGAVP